MEKIYKNASWDATKISYGFKYLFFISCMFMVGSVWGQINYYSKAIATDFNNTSSWGTNTDGTGTSPASISSADNYVIQNGSNMTLTGNASVRALTINAGSLTVSANTLTVTIASANNSQLLIAGGTLNLSSTGNIILNGNFSMTSGAFNQSGGSIVLDGNNSNIVASTVASGTNLFSISGGTPACSAGSITIVDPPLNTIATGSGTVHRSISISLSAGTNYFTGSHTFILGDGVSTTPGNTDGFVIETYASGYAPLQNVTVNGGNTTGRWGTASYNNATTYGCHIKGDLIINSNSEFRQQYASGLFAVGGNIVNNGILTVQGTAAASGLTLGTNSAFTTTNAQIVSGSGTFRNATTSPTANYSFLTINNTSAGGVTFSSAQSLLSGTNTGTVSGTLTLTNGIISTNGGTFILGTTGTSAGTLSYTAGGFTSGSSFSRWHTTTGTGATILASTLPSGTSTGIWPFVTGNPVSGMFSRHFYRNTTALTTAGRITVQYNDGTGFTSASLTDGAYTVNQLSNANWVVTNVGTAGTATPSYSIIANQLFNTTSANPRLIANGAVVGTQMAGLSNPVAQRSAIPTANQFSTFRIGINSVDVLNSTIASGSFDNPAIWSSGSVPACGSLAAISSSDSVWVNSGTTVTAGSILNNGRLSINGGTLTLGCNNNDSLTNNGRLYIASGTLYMNGNINNQSGSRFWQTGGNIYISGNSGSVATSVRTGVPLLWMQSNDVTLTGGTLNILRPHIGTATADRAITYVPTSTPYPNITGDHTLQFGDGVSTVSGGTNGFTIATGTRFQSGNMVINTNASPNVRVTTTGSYVIHGNLTITKGRFEIATGNTLVLAGNLTNNDTLITVGTLSFAKVLNANMSTPTTSPDSSVQTVSGTGRIFNNTTPASATANFSAITINNRQGFGGVTFANAFNQIGIQPANTISASGVLTFTLGTATTSSGVTFLLGSFGATPAVATAPSFTSGGFTSGSSFGYYMVAATTGTTTITSGTATSSTGFGRFPFVSSTGMDRSAWFERPSTGSAAGFIAATYNQVAGTTTGLTIADANSYTVTQRANDNWSFNTLGSTPSATSYEIAISAPNVFGASLSADSTRIVQASSAIGTYQRGTLLPHGQRVLTLSDLTSGAFYLGANDNEIPNSSVQSGDWNTASTWSKGVPTCTDNAIIQTGHTVTVSSAANAKNVEIQQGGVLTHNAGGALTVGCTLNNNLFSIKGGTFNMNAGTLSVNGKFELTANVNGIFNQSGGDIIVDGNSGSTSTSTTAHAVDLYCHTTSTLSLTGGTFTVVDPVASTTTGNCAFKVYPTVAHASGANWTLKLGNGTSTNPGGNTDGFLLNLTNSNSFAIGGDVILNNSSTWATNRHVTTSGSIPIKNLTITKGDWRFSSTHYISGNIVNNDTLTHHSTSSNLTLSNYSGTTASASTNAQTIGGTGVFRNNTTNASVTANLLGITINNTNATGVTLNVPLSVSGTLTMTSGIINTTSTNLLRLGTTSAAGTLSGTPSVTNFINGPFARTFPIRTASGTYTTATNFPVGVGGVYLPIFVDPQVITGPAIFTVNAINSNSGSNGAGVSNLASKQWSVVPDVSANVEGIRLQINDATVSSNSNILSAPSLNGTYDATSGSSTRTVGSLVNNSSTTIPFVNNFYTFGDLTPCTAPSDQPSLATTLLSSTRVNIQITPASSAPTGYLLVRFPTGTGGTPPTNPTDFTTHSGTLGTGTVIGYFTSPNLFVDNTGLTASTGYDYYAFSYNNTACLGPVYNTTSPAYLSVTTCSATLPSAATVGTVGAGNNVLPIANLTSSGFDLNWVAPATPPADYLVQVSTNSTFTNIVYNQPSGGATMASISGLNSGTTYFARVYSSDGTCVNTTALAFNHIATLSGSAVSSFSFNFDNGTSGNTTIWPSGVARYRANGSGTTEIVSQSTTNPASGTNSVVLAGMNTYITQGILVLPEVNNANAGTHRIRFKYSVSSTTNATCDFGYLSNPADPSSFTLLQNYFGSATNTNQEVTFNIPNTVPQNVFFAFRNPGPAATSGNLFLDDIIYESAPACTSPSLATAASASASVGTLCNSGTTVISATGYNKDSLGFTYQWQSSTDNFASNIVNIGTASASYSNYTTPSISTNMSYRLKTTCAGVGDAFSSAAAITVNTPSVTSTTGGSVCGNDSAILTGVPASGQTLRWYSVLSGGTALDTGNTFKTPPLSATTNYFVESSIVQTLSNVARTTNTATSGIAASNYGLVFDANQSFVIDSVTVYPSSLSVGSMQVVLQNNVGTQLLTTTVNVPAGTSTSSPQVAVQIPIGFSVPVGTGYRLLAVSSPSLFRESSIGGFPYPLGSFGSVTSGFITNPGSTNYYYFYNWKVTSSCSSSPRTSVTATYVTPPAFSLSKSADSACNGSASATATTITTGANNYTSYTWSPSTGVSGNSSSGWNFAPTATTRYIVTALDANSCKVLDTVDVRVDEMPSAISLSQGRTTPTCYSGFDSLMVSGGTLPVTSLNSYTLVSSSSTYTPLSGATSISFPIETDDDISAAIPIGFSFNFAGTIYSNVYVSTNGFISFNASAVATASNSLTSSAASVRPLIAPLWDDLDIIGGASYKLEGTSPNRTFIVEWNNVKWNWQASGAVLSFQAKLFEGTNNIEFLYRSDATAYNAGSTGGASVGLAGVSTGSGNFISLNSLGAAPTSSMTSETANISTKPATGQSYLFRAPTANTIWSPTIGLFTNRATTTAYAGTSLSKVYSKPTASQKYYLTATNGACQRRDSIVDSIKNASNLVVLTSANATGAVEQCTDANGWTYYGTAANPDEWLFGIYKNGNNFTATVDITVDNVNKFRKSASSNGANQEHASYIMSRNWNVNATGTVGSGVKVRFFIDPQDITDLLDERDNDYDLLKNTTNPNTLAVTGGFEWFKTVGTTYNPSNWTGNKHSGAIVKLTEDAVGTLNGQTYVELSGITSFSGGSGGTAFGPSNNGLFNNGGVVGLPVTWKDVKATAKENGNFVQWATSSEKNTKSFVVEYSYDAKEFFEASKDIFAAGNSATDRFYEFNHEEEYAELVYYRIKQIDLDGKVDYSKTVVVKRTSRLPEFHVSMYPVPLNIQDLTLRIQTIQKTDIAISINDLLGRSVYSQTISPAGYNTEHKMNLSHLPHGTYHVTINNGVNKSVQVLVVGK